MLREGRRLSTAPAFFIFSSLKSFFMKLISVVVACAGLLLLLPAGVALAQEPGSGGPTPNPTAVPIDGGASLLLAAGVGLGLKKLREKRRR